MSTYDDDEFIEELKRIKQEKKDKATEERIKKEKFFWEQRRWNLATKIYIQYPDIKATDAIRQADDLIKAYRKEETNE